MSIILLTIISLLLQNIIPISLNVNKIKKPSLKTRLLTSSDNPSLIDIPLLKSENLGFYSIDINIGEPSQKFSLIIDSGSSLLWVYDNKCKNCAAKNKFKPSDSKTFNTSEEHMDLSYVSGRVGGYLSQDNMNINNKVNLPMFYFILINESNIEVEIDGIIGISKGNSLREKYSFLSQLYEKKIIKNNLYIYDFFNKKFYIGEIPSHLDKEKKVSCLDNSENSKFWKCGSNVVKFDGASISMDTKIIFDSGTNGVAFPMKYLDIFKEIIQRNKVFVEKGCNFTEEEYDNSIYKFVCKKKLIDTNDDDTYKSKNIIEFTLEKSIEGNSNDNSFGLTLEDLMDEDGSMFSLYVFNQKADIMLGTPFFEKYPVMFNKDNYEITIFGKRYKVNKSGDNDNNGTNVLLIVIICIVVLLIIVVVLLILRAYFFGRKRIKSEEIDVNKSQETEITES